MGSTWVLSAPGGPHVGHMNLAIWVFLIVPMSVLKYDSVTWWHQAFNKHSADHRIRHISFLVTSLLDQLTSLKIAYEITCYLYLTALLRIALAPVMPYNDRTWSTYLTVSSHYLNQCWLIFSEVLWFSPEGDFTGNTFDDINHWDMLKYYTIKSTAISLRGQSVHKSGQLPPNCPSHHFIHSGADYKFLLPLMICNVPSIWGDIIGNGSGDLTQWSGNLSVD